MWLLIIIFFMPVAGICADLSKAVESNSSYQSRYEDTMSGRRYYNIEPVKNISAWDMIKWSVTGQRKTWPAWVEMEPGDNPPKRVEKGIRYTVVNQATVLIQVDGINILTDPIWSMRVGINSWPGRKRVVAPGITFDQLPPIDIVLISHNHYDHMDIPTLQLLVKRDNPLILTGLGNQGTLHSGGINSVNELDWWQSYVRQNIEIHFVPARHFSCRGIFDYNMSLWGGFVIKTPDGVIYFAGDTGYGGYAKEIRKKFGHIDLAFIPIGAYEPAWMMQTIHLTPEEAWQVHEDLESRSSVAIHFGTFQLADEGINEPAERLGKMASQNGKSSGKFVMPVFGKSVKVK